MIRVKFSEHEQTTLVNGLRVAAEQFDEHAKYFERLKPELEATEKSEPEKIWFVHSSACEPLAQQFKRQAAETRQLIEKIELAEEGVM